MSSQRCGFAHKTKIGVVLIRNSDWCAGHSYFQLCIHKSKHGLTPLPHLFNLLLVLLSIYLSPLAPFIPHKQDMRKPKLERMAISQKK